MVNISTEVFGLGELRASWTKVKDLSWYQPEAWRFDRR